MENVNEMEQEEEEEEEENKETEISQQSTLTPQKIDTKVILTCQPNLTSFLLLCEKLDFGPHV